MTAPLDIAVGVLVDGAGQLLIAKRRPNTPGAGFWEFPGGKQEPDEAIAETLARELAEEIGVRDLAWQPLIRFSHDRGPRPVRLHVARIEAWQGEPVGREGQTIRWCEPEALGEVSLLPATDIILRALALPYCYWITPAFPAAEASADTDTWLETIMSRLASRAPGTPAPMIRLRQPALADADYERLAEMLIPRASAYGAPVVLDRDAAMVHRLGAAGLHWPAARAADGDARPVGADRWFGVSAHDGGELDHAERLGADFATLSPVAVTQSHPDTRPLGWAGFEAMRGDRGLSVYALGGLGPDDLTTALSYNAQGVAGIRGFG